MKKQRVRQKNLVTGTHKPPRGSRHPWLKKKKEREASSEGEGHNGVRKGYL